MCSYVLKPKAALINILKPIMYQMAMCSVTAVSSLLSLKASIRFGFMLGTKQQKDKKKENKLKWSGFMNFASLKLSPATEDSFIKKHTLNVIQVLLRRCRCVHVEHGGAFCRLRARNLHQDEVVRI